MMRSLYVKFLLAAYADDALVPDGHTHRDGTTEWSHVRVYNAGYGPTHYSIPASTVTEAHLDQLAELLSEALSCTGSPARTLAAFHQRFVQLHPFASGNQCVVMNLVNQVLDGRSEGGIPHLRLDYFALLSSPEIYADIFERALAVYRVPGDDTAFERLAAQRLAAEAFFEKFVACGSKREAVMKLVRADPEAAALLHFPA